MRTIKLWLATIAMLLCSIMANAADFEVDGIYYNITSETDKTVEVTYCGNYAGHYPNAYSGSVTIPESVIYNENTYCVKTLGNKAFMGSSNLTSISIPSSVTTIGSYIFSSCKSLTTITIAEGNQKYDSRDNCNAIIETQKNTLIIGCQGTTIPNSVTTIGAEAFYACPQLTSIIIPNSVTTIGFLAFGNCTKLTSITIPNSVTTIESQAFSDCSSLTSITLSNRITTIEASVFEGCSRLTSITIPNSVTTIGYMAFEKCQGLTSITLPNSLKTIGGLAFSLCDALKSITIPNSVTTIGDNAFQDCSSLTSIDIPNSVTTIGVGVFANCTRMTSVTLPNNVTSIGNHAFSNCQGLTSITIPNTVRTIGDETFRNCRSLTNVIIPNSVTSIGEYAFYQCTCLTSITIPNSVTRIGFFAFEGCSALTTATVGCSWKTKSLYNFGKNVTVNATLHSYENGACTVCGEASEDEGERIELVEGTPFENEEAREVAQVTYNRTLPNLEWNALYLPVEIPVATLSENYDLAYFNNMHAYDRNNDGTVDEMDMEVFLINEGTLHANYPYFIRAKSEDAKQLQLVLEDVVLHAAEETSLTCSSVFVDFALTGVYARNDAETLSGCYAINTSGAWSPIAAGSYLNPFRLYMTITSRNGSPVKVSQSAMSRINIRVQGEDNATGITETENTKVKTENFDLSGRRVERMQKGIYIVNGKKVVR